MSKNDNDHTASIQLLPCELLAIITKYVGIVTFEFFIYYLNLKKSTVGDIKLHTGFFYSQDTHSNKSSVNDPQLQYREVLKQITNERNKIIIKNYIPIEWSSIPCFDIKEAKIKPYGPVNSFCSKIYKDLWYNPRLILILKQVCKSWNDAIQDDQRYPQRIFGFKLNDL